MARPAAKNVTARAPLMVRLSASSISSRVIGRVRSSLREHPVEGEAGRVEGRGGPAPRAQVELALRQRGQQVLRVAERDHAVLPAMDQQHRLVYNAKAPG